MKQLLQYNFQLQFVHQLAKPMKPSECISIYIRTHNLAGLYSTADSPLDGCTVTTVKTNIVIDAVGKWDAAKQMVRLVLFQITFIQLYILIQ